MGSQSQRSVFDRADAILVPVERLCTDVPKRLSELLLRGANGYGEHLSHHSFKAIGIGAASRNCNFLCHEATVSPAYDGNLTLLLRETLVLHQSRFVNADILPLSLAEFL